MNTEEKARTTATLRKSTIVALDSVKTHPRQSVNEVILTLIEEHRNPAHISLEVLEKLEKLRQEFNAPNIDETISILIHRLKGYVT